MINFENGIVKKESTVNIEGKEYMVNPRQLEGNTPLSAEILNTMQIQLKDEVRPDGSYFFTEEDVNPADLYGGTWEKIRTFSGGELIAVGTSQNRKTNSTSVNSGVGIAYSDNKIPDKGVIMTNYVDGILTFQSGTFMVHTKGIVGIVEVEYTLGGLGGNGLSSIWFGGNFNSLPAGVVIDGDIQAMKSMNSNAYCGCTGNYVYYVEKHIDNKEFFINPTGSPYGGTFAPAAAGLKCNLIVKVYARAEKTNVWKRTSTPEY